MDIQKKTCFTLTGRDRPGEAADITAALLKANVELEGLWGFPTEGGRAEFLAVPRDASAFLKAASEAGWPAEEVTCYRISGEDRRGALVELLTKISQEGISLRAVDAMALDGQFGCYLWAALPYQTKLEGILMSMSHAGSGI